MVAIPVGKLSTPEWQMLSTGYYLNKQLKIYLQIEIIADYYGGGVITLYTAIYII